MRNIYDVIKTIKDTIKQLDPHISKIMKNGLVFSLVLIIFATYILFIYHLINTPDLFYIGISLVKSSLVFGVAFFIFGISFNKIIKEII